MRSQERAGWFPAVHSLLLLKGTERTLEVVLAGLNRCCPPTMPPPSPAPSSLLFTISSHKGAVHTAVYNAGSSYILSGGADRQIKLTNAKSGMEVKTYGGHGYEVLGIAW